MSGDVRVAPMSAAELVDAMGNPLHVLEILLDGFRAAGESEERLLLGWSRVRLNVSEGWSVAYDLVDGRTAALELQLFGCAALKVHPRHEPEYSPEVFEYCTRSGALRAGFALALEEKPGEPEGWCRASRDCCAKRRETRPAACGRGEDCRFHGTRPEWDR